MGKKGAKKQKVEVPVKTKKAAPVKPPSDSEEDSSSEEEEVQVKAQQKKAVKVQPTKAAESSSEEESSEEETKAPQVTQKKGAAKKPADDDESSSEDDSDEEEQAKPAKKAAAVPQVTQKKGAVKRPAATNNEDDSSSEEDSDEEPPAKKAAPAAKKATQKKPAPTEDSDDDDDDSSEDDEEEAAPAKKAPDEDDSEDDDDEEEEEETVKVAETNKRKKEKGKQEPPVKKPKLDASVTNGEAEAVTLFVGNLDKSTTEDELSEFFTENGITVAEVRKPPNKSNAFVDLGDGDELETALALSGSTFKENTITVEKAKPRGQKEPRKEQQNRSFGSQGGGDDDRDSRTLFVKNLPEDATEDNLGEIFDTAASIRIPQKFGQHKGFGFIEFSDADTMEAAMSEKQGADLNGNSLYLDYLGARSNFKKQRGGPGGRGGDRRGRGNFGGGGGDRRQSNSGMRGESKVLFVSNLSYDTDESSLRSVFGGAVSARIPTFPDSGKPRGIAFVDFKSADAAAEAFDSMNGQSIDGRQVRLDFAAERGSGGGGGGGGFNSRGGGGFSPRGRGGRGGGRGRGGDRGRGRGGGRGGFNKARGGIVQSEGKKTTFDDSD